MTDHLMTVLKALPDEALVPVGWLRDRITVPDVPDGDADLSCADVARMLNRTASCVRAWCKSGAIKAYRFNNREWRIKRADLRRYQDAGGSKPPTTPVTANLGSWRGKRRRT